MTAGYSGTPLPRKLGIKEGHVVVVLGDPGHFAELVEPMPPGVVLRRRAAGSPDAVIWFVRRSAELEKRIARLAGLIHPAGALWVCWPKRASGMRTDVTEDTIRTVALPLGVVDVKVIAIDATWSGLRLVWRRELR